MGDFAISVAMAYQTGAAHVDYSILSAMEIRNDELFATFGGSIDDFIDQVFNFPTLGELYKYAAYDGLGRLQRRSKAAASG